LQGVPTRVRARSLLEASTWSVPGPYQVKIGGGSMDVYRARQGRDVLHLFVAITRSLHQLTRATPKSPSFTNPSDAKKMFFRARSRCNTYGR
jgi:hypothetical protein